MLFGKSFNSERDIPVLRDQVTLVTGGNAGIGEATVRALAAHSPRCIYLCARRPSSGNAAIRRIHSKYPDAKIEVLQLDLSSFDSVKKCATELHERSDRLDLLFLNAGVAMTAPAMTQDGYEYQFGGARFRFQDQRYRADENSQPHGPRPLNSTSAAEITAHRSQ